MSKQAERQRAKDRQRDEKERHEFIREGVKEMEMIKKYKNTCILKDLLV